MDSASSLWTDRETPASGIGGLVVEGARRLPAPARRALCRGLLRPRDQHPRRRAGGRRPDARRRVPAARAGRDRRRPGPRFDFGVAGIVNAPPARRDDDDDEVETPASVGFGTGEPALSGVDQPGLGGLGRALAAARLCQGARDRPRGGRRPSVDRLDVTLDARSRARGALRPDPRHREPAIDPGFIAYMADLEEGEPFDPDDIEAAQRRLNRLGVFRSLRFVEAEEIEPDGSLPITVARRGPPPAHHRLRRHALDDRRRRRLRLLAAPQPHRPRRAAALRRRHRRARRVARTPTTTTTISASPSPGPGVFNPDTNFVTSLVGQRVELRHLPRAVGHRRRRVRRTFGDRLTGEHLRRGLARPLRGRLRHPPLHDLRAGRPRRSTTGATIRSTPPAATISRVEAPAVLRGGVRQPRAARRRSRAASTGASARSAGRARRPRQGRQLRRARHGGKPARHAVLRRRRRVGARLPYRSIGVETIDAADEDSTSSSAARGCSRPRPRSATGSASSYGAVGFVDIGLRHREPGALRRERPSHRRRARRPLLYRDRHPAGRPRHAARPATRTTSPVALYIGIGQAF